MLAERLVPEGSWFKARAGRLRIDIQDSNHTFGELIMLVYCSSLIGEYNKITDVVRRSDK